MFRVALTLVAVMGLVGFSSATQVEDRKTTEKPVLDREFVEKATPCCHATIQYSELAERQATRPEVKAFAKKLVKEHKEFREELAKASRDQKVAVASGTEKPMREEMEKLAKLQGSAFDQAFLDRVVEDHEKAIKMCEAQADKGTDPMLKDFAKKCVPELKDHLKEAKALGGKSKTKDTDPLKGTVKDPSKP
jgi:putative membrane protein